MYLNIDMITIYHNIYCFKGDDELMFGNLEKPFACTNLYEFKIVN